MALSGSIAEIRLILTGQQEVIAGLAAVDASLTGLTAKMEETSAASKTTTDRSWAMNQALFTMRRYAYMGTLAVTALGAEAFKMGYTFNSTMQTASIALLPVMGNIGNVRGELEKLFNIAKYSPFQFKDLTIAFRSMYLAMQPLGISAGTVNKTIQALVDALSATGRNSPSNLNRVSVALQHMAYQGRLTGFTVNQLARDGIPIFAALSKEMGISGAQLHNISTLGIPASQVLAAINKYIETTPAYMNAAYRQAQSLHGQLTTIKDDISQVMGGLTLGAFNQTTSRLLPSIRSMFDQMSNLIVKQKGKISLDQVFGIAEQHFTWLTPFLTAFKQMTQVLQIFWNVIKNGLLPTLFIFFYLIEIFAKPIDAVLWALKLLTSQSWLLVAVLGPLIGLWTVGEAILIKKAIAAQLDSVWTAIQAGKTALLSLATKTYNIMAAIAVAITNRWALAAGVASIAQDKFWRAVTYMNGAIARLAVTIKLRLIPSFIALSAEIWAFLTTNPVGWALILVTALLILISTLVILYIKWKWFHDLVNETFTWIWEHWKLVSAILVFIAPQFAILLVVSKMLYDHWKLLYKLVLDFWNDVLKPFAKWITGIWNDVVGALGTAWKAVGDAANWVNKIFNIAVNWLDKVIDKLQSVLGLWKKIPLLGWVVNNALPAVGAAVSTVAGGVGHAASWVWNQPGIGKADSGGTLPSSAAALMPTPTTPLGKGGLNNILHVHVHIDGKQVASSVAKHRQNAIARGTRRQA